ncbi:MAG: VanZ family protein [Culicoidibacterales bacterium]
MNTKQPKWRTIGAGLLVVAWSAFIFSRSLQTGAESGSLSGEFVKIIIELFPQITSNFSIDQLQFFIRKLAHVSEYAILGFFLWVFWLHMKKSAVLKLTRQKYQVKTKTVCYTLGECRTIASTALTVSLFSGIIIALTDETIQTFIPNRAGLVIDVWIDFSGLTGMLLFLTGLWYLINKRKTVGK